LAGNWVSAVITGVPHVTIVTAAFWPAFALETAVICADSAPAKAGLAGGVTYTTEVDVASIREPGPLRLQVTPALVGSFETVAVTWVLAPAYSSVTPPETARATLTAIPREGLTPRL